jgi:hypothetical protein
MTDGEKPESDKQAFEDAPDRESERGDAAEPDAPTSVEENEGMSTVLSADTPSGVQEDEGEQ